jgi:hypothetical protein
MEELAAERREKERLVNNACMNDILIKLFVLAFFSRKSIALAKTYLEHV